MQPEITHLKNKVMTIEESEALLRQCLVGRIGTISNDGIPYVTPVNYVYETERRRIYIHHSSKGGKLLDNLKYGDRVCFEIDNPEEVVNTQTGKHICDIDQSYCSVICLGRMSIAGNDEKLRGLKLLGSKYAAGLSAKQTVEFEQPKLDRLVVLVIDIETISGKCRQPREQDL
jgi:uncharacterized protein